MTGPADDLVRAARGGLCAGCVHAALVRSSTGSVFLRCRHGTPPRYPPMPVLRCAAFAPSPRADAGAMREE